MKLKVQVPITDIGDGLPSKQQIKAQLAQHAGECVSENLQDFNFEIEKSAPPKSDLATMDLYVYTHEEFAKVSNLIEALYLKHPVLVNDLTAIMNQMLK